MVDVLFEVVFLLFCHFASPVNHSLRFILTGSAGVTNLPEFVSVVKVDELEMVYCDSNSKRAEPKQDWLKFFKENDREHVSAYTAECNKNRIFFRKTINVLIKCCSQTQDIHIFQRMSGCEWDDATGTVNTFDQYHYDENFIAFDLETETLTTPTPWARNAKHELDSNKIIIPNIKSYLTQQCLVWLKKYLDYGKSFLLRTVSLLQKKCSSVSCHATGFYPYKVDMFWRKDGEELHEDVGKGEILPNNDGIFQMSVELDISSVKPEDWSRYDCVFQLSGVKEDVVTKLDKAVIRTNDYFIVASPDQNTTPMIVAMLGLTVCLFVGTALAISFITVGDATLPRWLRVNKGFHFSLPSRDAVKWSDLYRGTLRNP